MTSPADDWRCKRAAVRKWDAPVAWRLGLLSAALFAPIGLHLPYFPVWLAARGLNDEEIALTLAAPLILRVGITPAIAHAADRQGIAATLVLCALAVLAAYTGLGWVAGFAPIFAVSAILIAAQGSMPALADALTLAEIRRLAEKGLGAVQFGRVRVGGSLSFLAVALLSGLIVQALPGEKIIFALAGLAVLPVLAAAIAAAQMPRLRLQHATKSGLTENPADLRLAILVIVAAALVQSSHAQLYTFATLHWKAIGLSPEFISFALVIAVLAESLLLVAGGRFLGRGRSPLVFLLIGAAGAVVRWISMSLDPDPLVLLPLQMMHAASFAATYIGAVLFLGALAGPQHRARIQGLSSAAMALSMALSTMACGKLTTLLGERAYLVMAGIAAAGLALALVAARSDRARARLAQQPLT